MFKIFSANFATTLFSSLLLVTLILPSTHASGQQNEKSPWHKNTMYFFCRKIHPYSDYYAALVYCKDFFHDLQKNAPLFKTREYRYATRDYYCWKENDFRTGEETIVCSVHQVQPLYFEDSGHEHDNSLDSRNLVNIERMSLTERGFTLTGSKDKMTNVSRQFSCESDGQTGACYEVIDNPPKSQ